MPPKPAPGPKPGSRRFRNWMFTHFYEVAGEETQPPAWGASRAFESSDWILFLCGQDEICPETQRRHFQGYVHGRSALGIRSVQEQLGLPNIHLEVRRGRHEEALDYCTKIESRAPGADPVILGDPPRQGARKDLDEIKGILDTNRDIRSAFEHDFTSTVRYYRGFEKYLSTLGRARNPEEEPECYYYHGASGAGKTRAAYDLASERETKTYAVSISGSNRWFDGYVPGHHGVILIDDYKSNWPATFFLNLLDRYPMLLPVKGAFVKIGKAVIIVTSNYPLEAQYPDYPDQNALRRRFTQIVYFNKL